MSIFDKALGAYHGLLQEEEQRRAEREMEYQAAVARYRQHVETLLRELYPDDIEALLPLLDVPGEMSRRGVRIEVPDSFPVLVEIASDYDYTTDTYVISRIDGYQVYVAAEYHAEDDRIWYDDRRIFGSDQLLEAIGCSVAHREVWTAAVNAQFAAHQAPPQPKPEPPLTRIANALEIIAHAPALYT